MRARARARTRARARAGARARVRIGSPVEGLVADDVGAGVELLAAHGFEGLGLAEAAAELDALAQRGDVRAALREVEGLG